MSLKFEPFSELQTLRQAVARFGYGKWAKIFFVEREFFVDNLLVRIHFIIVMIRWTGLALGEFEFPFPGSLTSTFLTQADAPASRGAIRVREVGQDPRTLPLRVR